MLQLIDSPLLLPAIFQNVEHIYELHHKLYKDLREAMWEKRLLKDMGRLMLQYTPFFRLYITYVNDYGLSGIICVERQSHGGFDHLRYRLYFQRKAWNFWKP